MLIQPKLFAPEKGDSAYWQDFNWDLAARAGMERVGLPYSGEYGFVKTKMYWPVNHMVSTKDKSVQCSECHTRDDEGRLAKLTGFYLPGRDRNFTLDYIGGLLFLISLLGVILHGAVRAFIAIKKNKYEVQIINNEE